MIKMFWTMLLLSGVFTFSTIAAVVIKAMVSTEVSSEAEEQIRCTRTGASFNKNLTRWELMMKMYLNTKDMQLKNMEKEDTTRYILK